MEVCSSYRYAVSQQKCTAALGRAHCIPHCSVLLCKTGSQQAWVTAVTPVEICFPYRCAVRQQKCTAAVFTAKCDPRCSVLLCKTKSQQIWPTAVTPVEICFSYSCAVTQQKCIAALVRAKCNPHCSVLLCKTGSQQALVTAVTPVEICCSYRCAVTQQKCTTALVSVALQNKVTADLGHCNYTCGDLLLIQVCSDPTKMHSSSVQGLNPLHLVNRINGGKLRTSSGQTVFVPHGLIPRNGKLHGRTKWLEIKMYT